MSDAATLINNVQVLVGLGVTLVAGIVLQKVCLLYTSDAADE